MKKIILFLIVMLFIVGCSNGKENSYEDNQHEEQNKNEYEETRQHSDYVDVEALNAIEKNDSFGLRVIGTDYIEDHFIDEGFGNDDAVVYIKNFSSETIVEFQIYAVAYSKDLSKTLFRDSEDVTWYTVPNVNIAPGEEYVLEIACHGESFYDFKTFIRNYETATGEFVSSELAEEWYDIAYYGTGKKPVMEMVVPPEAEYDEIISHDDRYYLCKKQESGFEKNVTLYGIYDVEEEKWTVDFIDLGEFSGEFLNKGDGVFTTYRSSYYGTDTYFISSDYGSVFEMELEQVGYSHEEVFFNEGKAFVLVDSNSRSAKEPDSYMHRVSTLGELEEVDVPGFSKKECFWISANVVSKNDETIYARFFKGITENDSKYYLYVYMYETDKSLVIDIDKYYDNLTLCIGVTDVNSMVSFDGNSIRINKVEGADGKDYYIEYDISGNLITEPTLM